MANNVTVVQTGGSPELLNNVKTVSDVMNELDIESGLAVTINGKSASEESTLSDYAFVSFGKKVGGGAN